MLMEFVVAAALVMTLLGSVLTLVDPTRSSLRVQPQAAEMHQRMRVAFARIHADLMMAGSGPNLPSAATGASVASLRAPLVPHRIGHRYQRSVGRQFARDAISVLYAPPQTAGATLASSLVSSTQDVRLVSAAPCRSSTATCGLDADTLALVFDEDGRSDVVRVTRVLRNIVSLERVGAGLPEPFSAGASIVPLRTRSYYLDTAAAQIRYQDGWDTDVPLIDNAVGLSFRYFGSAELPAADHPTGAVAPCLAAATPPRAGSSESGPEVELSPAVLVDGPLCGGRISYDIDLFRVRRVRVEIRLQVSTPELRGPDRSLFARPGAAVRGTGFVPDYVTNFEVMLRNALANQ